MTQRIGLRYQRIMSCKAVLKQFTANLSVDNRTGLNRWDTIGAEPYLDVGDGTSYVFKDTPNGQVSGDYFFANLPLSAYEIIAVTLLMRLRHDYPLTGRTLLVEVYDGFSDVVYKDLVITTNDWRYVSCDVGALLNTVAKVNAASIKFWNDWSTPGYAGYVDHAYLEVKYKK
jgi:hypothetical protein